MQAPWFLNALAPAPLAFCQPLSLHWSLDVATWYGSKSYVVLAPFTPTVTASAFPSKPAQLLPALSSSRWPMAAFGNAARIWFHEQGDACGQMPLLPAAVV